MHNFLRALVILILYINNAWAEPFMAYGPSILSGAEILPIGHSNVSIVTSQKNNFGIYDPSGLYIPSPMYFVDSGALSMTFGYSKTSDFNVNVSFFKNISSGVSFTRIGDTLLRSEHAIFQQGESNNKSNLLIDFSLIVPTGKFQNLNPALFTTDATGAGTYQPSVGLRGSHTFRFSEEHYLRIYSNFRARYSTKVRIKGLSAYGGDNSTNGSIRPGNAIDLGLGFEYSLTQNITFVFEGYGYLQQKAKFNGIISEDLEELIEERSSQVRRTGPNGEFVRPRILFNTIMPSIHNINTQSNVIGSAGLTMFSISPSIEYSFNADVGIIFSFWVTTPYSKSTPAFYCPSIGISASR